MPLGLPPFDTFTITRQSGSTRGSIRETPGDIWGIVSELKSLAVTELAGMKKPRRSEALDSKAYFGMSTAWPLATISRWTDQKVRQRYTRATPAMQPTIATEGSMAEGSQAQRWRGR